MLKNPFLPIVAVIPFPRRPFLPNPSSFIISLATDLQIFEEYSPPAINWFDQPSGGRLGLVGSVGLHFNFHHFKRIDDNGLSDPGSEACQWVGLEENIWKLTRNLHDLPTMAPGFSEPNRKTFWNCSNVKNFQALFGVSTRIGGSIPFQNESNPSWWYIFVAQSLTPA